MKKKWTGVFAAVLSLTACCLISAPAFPADQPYVVAGVGKDRTTWFIRHESGVLKGAKENGMKGVYATAPTADEVQQVRIIDEYIAQGVNALLVVPNNAKALEASFAKAREKGIAVITHESQGQVNADFDIEMFDNTKFGELMIDQLVTHTKNQEGSYAIYVGSLTVPAHNMWADAAIARQKAIYPQLKFIDKFPVSEDRTATHHLTKKLLKDYPDLIGILCMGSEGAPAVAQILWEQKIKNKIKVLGVTTPNISRRFLKEGYLSEILLWDPAEAAKIQAYIAKMVLEGRSSEIKPGFEIPGFGKPLVIDHNLIFNRPLQITKDNVDDYDF